MKLQNKAAKSGSSPASCCASFVRMFKPQFAGLVERGEKLQTVRPTPKRMPKPGDQISLRAWSDKPYRSKQKLLNEGIITRVTGIEITNDGVTLLPESSVNLRVKVSKGSFAVADGFSCWEEMRQWFERQHGLPFVGVLISWQNVDVMPPLKLMACERCGTKRPEPALHLCDNCGDSYCLDCYNPQLYECLNCAPNSRPLPNTVMIPKPNNEARAGLPAGALFSVFRIQDKDGRGPFKPGFLTKWVEDREDHENLVPWYVDIGRVDQQMIAGMSGGTACRTLDQLRRWFTPGEYKTLRRYGYQAIQIEIGRILGESETQLVFERCLPLTDGVTPVELYPENVKALIRAQKEGE